jgi:hypothetical protein
MRKSARTRIGLLAQCRHVVLPALSILGCLLSYPRDLPAQGRVVAQAPVDIVIQAASSLSLRIGTSGGAIDRVSFTVNQLPGSGSVPGVSSGANPVPVRASSTPGNATKILTADSSIPVNDGAGHTIPFTEISWTGTNGVPSGTFAGLPNQQIYAGTQSINNGTMSFSYANTVYVPSGTYSGRVTYTLSSP